LAAPASELGAESPGGAASPCRACSGPQKGSQGMESLSWGSATTRRDFIKNSTLLAAGLALPAGLARVSEAIAAGELKDVPRNRTLATVRGGTDGKFTEHELWSPYVTGSNPQLGGNIIYEPPAFYSAFADKEILWLSDTYSN